MMISVAMMQMKREKDKTKLIIKRNEKTNRRQLKNEKSSFLKYKYDTLNPYLRSDTDIRL